MGRKNPDTSISAYRQAGELITDHHAKIIGALRGSKLGMIYEQIAGNTKLEKHQIGRRLSELEAMQLVYKPGEKRKTSANRDAYVYKLTALGEAYIIPDKYLPGKTISEYAKAIQAIQPTLFDS